jgi:hypothetical protein
MKPQTQLEQQKTSFIEAEIQHNIPVKQHSPQQKQSPSNIPKQFVEQDSKKDPLDDSVLRDVNKSVKDSSKPQSKKPLFSFHKNKTPIQVSKHQAPNTAKTNKMPAAAITLAITAAGVLCISAAYAFSHQKSNNLNAPSSNVLSSKSGQSNNLQTSKLTSVDISKDSSELKSKINSLNDAQDFSDSDISDSALNLQ